MLSTLSSETRHSAVQPSLSTSLDEFHLLDLGHLLSHTPMRVEALDLSVNRLAIPEPVHSQALKSVISILDPR